MAKPKRQFLYHINTFFRPKMYCYLIIRETAAYVYFEATNTFEGKISKDAIGNHYHRTPEDAWRAYLRVLDDSDAEARRALSRNAKDRATAERALSKLVMSDGTPYRSIGKGARRGN